MVEYSELDQTLASAINQETGRLRFCWSNVHPIPCAYYLHNLFTTFCTVIDLYFALLL